MSGKVASPGSDDLEEVWQFLMIKEKENNNDNNWKGVSTTKRFCGNIYMYF